MSSRPQLLKKAKAPEKLDIWRPEWLILWESGHVREEFLDFGPDDAEMVFAGEDFQRLHDLYSPLSKARNLFERRYMQLVLDALDARVRRLFKL